MAPETFGHKPDIGRDADVLGAWARLFGEALMEPE
jgi:hypothetical protein